MLLSQIRSVFVYVVLYVAAPFGTLENDRVARLNHPTDTSEDFAFTQSFTHLELYATRDSVSIQCFDYMFT